MSLDVLKNVPLSLDQTILQFVSERGSTPSTPYMHAQIMANQDTKYE
jgi:hypothetical protein